MDNQMNIQGQQHGSWSDQHTLELTSEFPEKGLYQLLRQLQL